jgi:hypothetical protein
MELMATTTLNPRFLFGAALIGLAIISIVIAGIRNIQSSQGPKERRFILLMTPVLWALLASFMTSVYWLDSPWRYFAGAAHFVLVPLFMYHCTLRRQLIREYESRHPPRPRGAPET